MKRILFFIVVGASLVIINNLIHSIYNLSQKKDLITQTKSQLAKEQEENSKLKQLVAEATKPQFVDEEARDKLQMVKPGEEAVIMPPLPSDGGRTDDLGKQEKPHWQQWLGTFF